MLIFIVNMIRFFLSLYVYLVLGRIIGSWFIRPGDKLFPYYMILIRVTEPVIQPFRNISNRLTGNSGLDLAPMLSVLAIYMVYRLIIKLFILSVM